MLRKAFKISCQDQEEKLNALIFFSISGDNVPLLHCMLPAKSTVLYFTQFYLLLLCAFFSTANTSPLIVPSSYSDVAGNCCTNITHMNTNKREYQGDCAFDSWYVAGTNQLTKQIRTQNNCAALAPS